MTHRQNHGPFYQGQSSASVGRERTGEVNVGGTFYKIGGAPAPSPPGPVTIDFETIGLTAGSPGIAVGTYFLALAGATFSANARAYNKGTELDFPVPVRAGQTGYCRGMTNPATGDPTSFRIDFAVGSDFKALTLDIANPSTISTIYAFGDVDGLVVLNSTLHDFSNASGWAWTATPFTLVDGSLSTRIDHIVFTPGRNGLAIDNLVLTPL